MRASKRGKKWCAYKTEIGFLWAYLSAKMPAAADPVTMPAKWAVPINANKYWFSTHVIDHSSTMVFSYLSYTQRLHLISFLSGSSRPHMYDELPSVDGNSYRLHCSGVNKPDESVLPGTVPLTHGSSKFGLFASSQPGTKQLFVCVTWSERVRKYQKQNKTKQSI